MLNNNKKLIGLVLVLVIFGALVKSLFFTKSALITVVGEGKVSTVPQMVKFSVAILNTASSSTQVIMDNQKIVKDVVSVLKGSGVEEKDINLAYVRVVSPQTSGLSVFQAVNSIQVTLKDISKFDNLVIQLYGNGVASVSSIVFTTPNSLDLEKQAVSLAIDEAKLRAKELAKASKMRLGRMVSIATAEAGEAGAVSGSGSNDQNTKASPSQIEIIRQASIVFELK